MAPKPKSQTIPAYSCGTHWHFEPHKDEIQVRSRPVPKPWYLRKEFPEVGKYPVGTRGIYARNSSSNGTFSIHYQLASKFYSLKDDGGTVQRCLGRDGRLRDCLWREQDLSTQPWIPPPSYDAVNTAAYTAGYEHK